MSNRLMSPDTTEPFWTTWLETITAMISGTVAGGGVALPVSVVQLPPHTAGSPVGLSSNPAKPFIEAGGGPPLIGFNAAHWLLHQVTVGPVTRSPITKRSEE